MHAIYKYPIPVEDSFLIEMPPPPARQNLRGWREFFGYDRNGGQGVIKAVWDAQAAVLTLSYEGEIPKPAAVEAFHGETARPPGPLSAEQWKTLLEGGEVRLSLF